jgi:hypothetical protein
MRPSLGGSPPMRTLDPKPHFTSVGFGASNAGSLKCNCGMLGREHFVDLFRRRFYHLTFIVWHF